MKIRTAPFTLAASLSALMLSAAPALAQHGEHGQHENEEAEIVEPDSYAHALEVIHTQLEKIEGLMDRGQLDRVHKEAAVIRDVAKTLVRLALEQNSGVPRSAIREINLTAKDLAAKFGPIDEAGDSGNLAGTRKGYAGMVALFETLEKSLPQRYVCPMRCEPGKTYNAPGSCPVCHMYLKKMTDEYSVEAKSLAGVLEPGGSTLRRHHPRRRSSSSRSTLPPPVDPRRGRAGRSADRPRHRVPERTFGRCRGHSIAPCPTSCRA